MAEHSNMGVYQLENGNWAWRFTRTVDGKRVNRKGTKDAEGNPLHSQKEAIRAREIAMMDFSARLNEKPKRRVTVQEVYEEYCAHGRSGKAYGTIRKQESLWKNHLSEKFGLRYIDNISVAEVNDYLAELYFVEGRAYRYVEGFLKMFYLIFGQAYSRGYLDLDTYNKLCVTKDCRIQMPKMKVDEDTDIVAYDREQTQKLDDYFSGTNAETAYLLGRLCGLRINECYGLKWCNVDLEKGTILIDRQMQYQNGLIKLVPPKTLNANRVIYLPAKMKAYFQALAAKREKDAKEFAALREQRQRFIDDLDGGKISSTELVNCLPDGTIQTVNTMKYPTREIKKSLGIEFKYHYLRHTYGTLMAEMNTPTHLLCNQMGHGNIHVTQRYYLAISKSGIEALNENLNRL